MKLIYLPSLMFLLLFALAAKADSIDNIAGFVKQGNTQAIGKLFAASVEFTISGQESLYSDTQATLVLNKFFNDNKPKSVKILHRVNSSSNYLFGVMFLTTDNGIYRISVTLSGSAGDMKIIELRIEAEKTK
jgi:hypothetical protein